MTELKCCATLLDKLNINIHQRPENHHRAKMVVQVYQIEINLLCSFSLLKQFGTPNLESLSIRFIVYSILIFIAVHV